MESAQKALNTDRILAMTELICRQLTRRGTYLSPAGEEQWAKKPRFSS